MSPLLEMLRAARAETVPPDEVHEVLGLLMRLQAALLQPGGAVAGGREGAHTPVPTSAPERDVWLTADEVAARLHRSRAWVYRIARRWSFVRRPTRKTLLISERGLDHYMRPR